MTGVYLYWLPLGACGRLATAHRLQVAQGRRPGGGTVRTFASSFLDELGPERPEPVRGEDWDY
jgi:hypothetical protein